MDSNQIRKLTLTFDEIAHTTDGGVEYWLARELQLQLAYSRWEDFEVAVKRAMIACEKTGVEVETIFGRSRKWSQSVVALTAIFKTICLPDTPVIS